MSDLVVINAPLTPTLSILPTAIDYAALERQMIEEEQRGGMFPGDILNFKKGRYRFGFGEKSTIFNEASKSLILNLPNMWFGWQTFDDGKPVFGPIARPALGEKLPERKAMGKTDKEMWEVDKDGKPMDPWKRYAAIPFRFDGEDHVNTLLFGNWSSISAVRDLLKTFAREGRTHFGKLPVVNLGVREDKHWDDDTITFFVPTFEIVDWETPTEKDVPDATSTNTTIPEANVQPVDRIKQEAIKTAAAQVQTVQTIKQTANIAAEVTAEPSFDDTIARLDKEEREKEAARKQRASERADRKAADEFIANKSEAQPAMWPTNTNGSGRRRSGLGSARK